MSDCDVTAMENLMAQPEPEFCTKIICKQCQYYIPHLCIDTQQEFCASYHRFYEPKQ